MAFLAEAVELGLFPLPLLAGGDLRFSPVFFSASSASSSLLSSSFALSSFSAASLSSPSSSFFLDAAPFLPPEAGLLDSSAFLPAATRDDFRVGSSASFLAPPPLAFLLDDEAGFFDLALSSASPSSSAAALSSSALSSALSSSSVLFSDALEAGFLPAEDDLEAGFLEAGFYGTTRKHDDVTRRSEYVPRRMATGGRGGSQLKV